METRGVRFVFTHAYHVPWTFNRTRRAREAEAFLVASWMFCFCVFAGRKYTQEVKDDIGDKSVFIFRSLKTDEERRDYLEKQGKDLSLLEDAM